MNVEQVEAACASLTPLLKNSLRTKIKKTSASSDLSVGEALVYWIADWLLTVRLIKEVHVMPLTDEFYATVIFFGDELAVAVDDEKQRRLPVMTAAVMDRRHIRLDGHSGLFDLDTGMSVNNLQHVPMEMIVYNLVVLHSRYLAKTQKGKNNGSNKSGGDVAMPVHP